MNYHFISDNNYFLQGVMGEIPNQAKNTFFIHTGMLKDKFSPLKGDIVVLNINEIRTRRNILCRPEMKYCRVIILFRSGTANICETDGKFPWLLPDDTEVSALISCISLAKQMTVVHRIVSSQERYFFHHLAKGYSVTELTNSMGYTAKYLFLLKRKFMARYGLLWTHAAAVLVCRDITGI